LLNRFIEPIILVIQYIVGSLSSVFYSFVSLLQSLHEQKFKAFIRPYWILGNEVIRCAKNILIKPLQKIPISSEIIGPPKGFYESTRKWVITNQTAQTYLQYTYREIYPIQLINRSAPKTLDEIIHWKFKIEYRRALPASFVVAIPRGRVWVNKGRNIDYSAIITGDDRILSDVSLDFKRLSKNHSIFGEWKLPAVHHIEGTAAVLTSAKAHIYFHWLTDLLPRIELLRQSGISFKSIDKFIVNSYNYPFQRETLTTLGIPSHKIIESCKYPHIKAEQLFVPSLPGLSGNPPHWVCEFLRREFLSNSDSDTQKIKDLERVYISRSDAQYRKVINEDEVTAFLAKRGFKIIALEPMSITEKAALFASVNVVIAPHGSGITNTVFCQPGTKLIEIFSPNYVNVITT
jgi:capsular polysaccharide biosynthesis protein